MRLTIFILLLPVVMFFVFVFLLRSHASDMLELPFFIFWILTALVCFVRGLFIFRQHRRLAWCCFGVTLLQFILAILPLLARHKIS
jgi:cytochrome bd-type quinol oxidase subunit 2